jgi:hypothetical protein
MKTTKQLLLKHFSLVLRNRANGNNEPISTTLLKYLSRKDLVEVIQKIHNGNIPKELDLTLLENEELLTIIGDELFVISFITEKWCKEKEQKLVLDEKGRLLKEKNTDISKPIVKNKK